MPNGYLQAGQNIGDQTEDNTTVALNVNGKLNVAGGKRIISNVPIGSIALASMGTSTTGVVAKSFITDIFVPHNRVLSTFAVLSGAADTNNWTAAIYDSFGTLIATGIAAGVAIATVNVWQTQAVAFVYPKNTAGTPTAVAATSVQLYGPQQYFIAIHVSNTTGTIQTLPSPYIDLCTENPTDTFGTFPTSITPPTTFTTNIAPIVYIA